MSLTAGNGWPRYLANVYARIMDAQTPALRALMRFYEAEARYSASGLPADRAALLETLHPDIVLHQPDSLPYGGQWRGREEFGRWIDSFVETWVDIKPTDPVFHTCGERLKARLVLGGEAGEFLDGFWLRLARETGDQLADRSVLLAVRRRQDGGRLLLEGLDFGGHLPPVLAS